MTSPASPQNVQPVEIACDARRFLPLFAAPRFAENAQNDGEQALLLHESHTPAGAGAIPEMSIQRRICDIRLPIYSVFSGGSEAMRNASPVWLAMSLLFFGLGGPDAVAQSVDGLRECQRIANDARRLACYDAVVATASATRPAMPSKAPVQPATDTGVSTVTAAKPAGAVESRRPTAAAPAPAAADDTAFGDELLERREEQPDELVSRIVGDFDGWWGDTQFRLENGQVWVQAQSGRKRYKGPPNPKVTIRRRALGSYRLQVEGSNKTVRVKRLE